ncbi:Translational repressor MPT5/PUF4 and related RNA-binding proteins (Puf superfamily) [Handroanthus impetiginosus]|uniref:Translational repressor MPT5/PUF4 and related RNA-binding proteins (Puf superfamily) n=1 Tax=Handroanthus impetiginosus TaxID=429701 RepID=A0A2G9G778_9LAMI|nr:Translational repressor MPT5/PUF4 and related RNA-binding proteins (Puf superfamily) [Handroanthus impetiginosus]
MSSAYQTPSHGQNPSGIIDFEDVLISFGSLELNKDETFQQRTTASQDNNASSSGFNLKEENDTNSKKIKNPCFQPQETSDKSQFCDKNPMTSGNAAADHQRILGFHHYFPTHAPYFVNNSPFLCPGLSSRPMGQYTFDKDRFREIMNTGLYSDNSWWNQNRGEVVAESQHQIDLKWMQELLEWGDYQQKQQVISVLKGSIFQLMTDKQISFIFDSLVEACEDDQLNSIVGDVLSNSDFFINAACCIEGANSIAKLIGRLKNSHDHAFTMTRILSTRFLDLMTHRTARIVINQCLTFFGTQPNKILYEKAIDHFKFLAIHEVGCLSLNDCINTISGEQRDILLDKIAEVSDYLLYNPFGNFVIQNILELRDLNVTAKILTCLKGQFVYLSQKKGGSHIVERCMESSYIGLECVVQEIVKTPNAAILLAQNQFGNYVVQRALKMTKIHGCSYLHNSLVQNLVPYCRELNFTKGGKNIIHLLQ